MKNPKALVKILQKEKPKTHDDFYKLFKLKHIGSGAFRNCYELVGWGAVVKIPRPEDSCSSYEGNLYHAQVEIKAIRKIMKKAEYEPIRSFVPEVYYDNLKAGIIVMKKYRMLRSKKEAYYVAKILQQVFNSFLGKEVIDDSDISSWNIGADIEVLKNKYGNKWTEFHGYKIFDLGMV